MNKRNENRSLALERIQRLLELAEEIFEKNPELSDKYVKHAWRIATRYNVRFPKELKLKFCRKCLSFMKPGVTCRIRTRSKPPRVVITCLKCGHVRHVPYKTKPS